MNPKPTPAHAAAIQNLEQMLSLQTPTLSKTAPKQLQEMKALLKELKGSPTGQVSPASQKTLKNLFIWQLDLKKAGYQQKIDALEPLVTKDPKAAKAQKALKNVMTVLDEAKRAMAAPPAGSAQALKQIEAASDRARSSLLDFKKIESQPPPAPMTTAMRKSLTGALAIKDVDATPPPAPLAPRGSSSSMKAVTAPDADATPPPNVKTSKAAAPDPRPEGSKAGSQLGAPKSANPKPDSRKNGKK